MESELDKLARPGTIRVRLRVNAELWGRGKNVANKLANGKYTTYARRKYAEGVLLDEAKLALDEAPGGEGV
jgi:hypothetical protein